MPVHPCRRREHFQRLTRQLKRRGSSLQAQGTHGIHFPKLSKPRFIPAGAGNTGNLSENLRVGAVHPCRRREHFIQLSNGRDSGGSSLQAQGTPLWLIFQTFKQRFIPAGAGNTSCSAPWACNDCGSSLQAQGTRD